MTDKGIKELRKLRKEIQGKIDSMEATIAAIETAQRERADLWSERRPPWIDSDIKVTTPPIFNFPKVAPIITRSDPLPWEGFAHVVVPPGGRYEIEDARWNKAGVVKHHLPVPHDDEERVSVKVVTVYGPA